MVCLGSGCLHPFLYRIHVGFKRVGRGLKWTPPEAEQNRVSDTIDPFASRSLDTNPVYVAGRHGTTDSGTFI